MTVENWFGTAGDLSLLVTAVKVLRQTGKYIWDRYPIRSNNVINRVT
jgi:hypothetical protein